MAAIFRRGNLGHSQVCIALIFVSYYSTKIGFGLLGALLTALYFLNLDDPESTRFPVPRDSVELGNVQAI